MPESRHDLLQRLAVSDSFARRPGNFADRPEGPMDAISEILSGVRLNGALFFSAELSAPWRLSAPASKMLAAELAPGAAHLVLYHLLIDGEAFVQLTDERSGELNPGDVVIFPHGDPHHMTSSRGATAPFPSYGISAKIKARDLSPLRAGGGGETARFVCGYMTCDPYLNRPILNGLPPVFKVNIRADRSGHWLESSILHLVEEAARDEWAAKPCFQSCRRPCLSTPCGATLAACPNNKWGGSRERAIPSSGSALDCCTAALRVRGPSRI